MKYYLVLESWNNDAMLNIFETDDDLKQYIFKEYIRDEHTQSFFSEDELPDWNENADTWVRWAIGNGNFREDFKIGWGIRDIQLVDVQVGQKLYVVVESYFKNGQATLSLFSKERDLKDFMINYYKNGVMNAIEYDDDIDVWIKLATSIGYKRINREQSWGIVDVCRLCSPPF